MRGALRFKPILLLGTNSLAPLSSPLITYCRVGTEQELDDYLYANVLKNFDLIIYIINQKIAH